MKTNYKGGLIGGNAKHVGLARVISKLGYCSRTQAARLVREGRVRLNGTVTKNPEAPVRIGKDRIQVDGKHLGATEKIYLALNKPRGIVTTASDEKGRETVYSLLPSDVPWVSPVGRLDQASEGLLFFTNDSEWAARVTDPESHLDKTYNVQIGMVADERLLQALERGMDSDGERLRAKGARLLRSGEKNSWIEIVLDEGKNRQIRRMLEGLGIEVLRLIRVSIGPVRLGELGKGAHRVLRVEEKDAIDATLGRGRVVTRSTARLGRRALH
jgi:23S rRNA pseudouridine2605 synthase